MSTLNVGTIKSISSAAPVFQNTSGTEKGQLVKAWANLDQTGSQSIRDSFNVSSVTDVSVGTTYVNYTNNMSNTDYCGVIYNNATSTLAINTFGNNYVGGMICDADKIQVSAYTGSGFIDSKLFTVIVIGDN